MQSGQSGDVLRLQVSDSRSYIDKADIVIIGNGIAGLSAAIEARRHLPNGYIAIITDQLYPTINTPALKQFAIAKLVREQLLAYPVGTERAKRIHVINAHAKEIQAQSKYVCLSGNRKFSYDSLLIATGCSPKGLPERMPGHNFDGVMTLHRLQDYLDLRRRVPQVRKAIVIGGGTHACDAVTELLYWGIRVHWLIRGRTFMANILDQGASEMVLNNLRRAGAVIHTDTEVSAILGRVGAAAGVITNHHEMIPCELVVACTGLDPVMSLVQNCNIPMQCENGIVVDERLRTNVHDIYAAGSIAALYNPLTRTYQRQAQWYAAVAQGRIAGAAMAGQDELAHRPFGVPWHATQLGGLSMLTVGDPLSEDRRAMILTDTSQTGYRRLAIVDDRLVGYLSVGTTQPDSLAIKSVIDEGHSIRSVTKALLKGNFNAREYVAERKSFFTRKLVTGQLLARRFRA